MWEPRPSFMSRLRDDQRGATAVIVAVCLFALFGAMMLTVDAGNLWATRRQIITGTDASALHAAQFFNSGGGNPCNADDLVVAENGAADVMVQNHSRALHNPDDTPDGFQVTTAQTCGLSGYTPGKVRFDGRLYSQGFFGGAFGFSNQSAYSSSTAAWGYITAISDDLRPIPVCDKSEGYDIWTDYWNTGQSPAGLATYNGYFGRDEGNPDPNLIEFPASSSGYINGDPNGAGRNPNAGLSYVTPDGVVGSHTTVHRVTMPDAACGVESGNWLWVDFVDQEGGSAPTSVLADWILHGYQGTVALDPHDCNPSNENPTPEDCGAGPGVKSALEKSLHDITCAVTTPARSCPHVFPILVVSDVVAPTGGGDNVHYVQVAFLFVVIRGYGALSQDNQSNKNVQIDMEFLDVSTSGQVSGSPPTTTHPYQTGTQLCGADHDSMQDRCPF
jgi:hypothetical protein